MTQERDNRATRAGRRGIATRVAAVLALAVLAFLPAPAGAGHNPDLIPIAPGAEFRVLSLRLFEAAQKGETEKVVQLLAEGAPVEARDRFGNTALLVAARAGRTKAVQVLLEAGSEIDHQNLRGADRAVRARDPPRAHRRPAGALRLCRRPHPVLL